MPLLEFAELLAGPYVSVLSKLYVQFTKVGVAIVSDEPILSILAFLCLLPFGLVLIFLCYRYLKMVGKKKKDRQGTEFLHGDTPVNRMIKSNIQEMVGEYKPPWWYSSHMGTLLAFSSDCGIVYHREIMTTDDNEGQFCLSWYPLRPPSHSKEPYKFIIYVPGLGLYAKSVAVQKYVKTCAAEGYIVIVVGPRGLDTPLTSATLWHPGRYEDVLHTVHFLHAQFPCASIRLCGYSAGSNLCLQTLFHLYSHHQLHLVQSCCVVCICYDYFQARHRLENSSIGLVYSVLMCLLLKDIIRKNMHMFHHREEYIESCLSRCLLLSHYDRIVGKELHGYREMDELQRRTNLSLLRKIPILAIQPEDDPLHMGSARENVRVDELVSLNPHFLYMEPSKGNHFGFYEGSLLQAFDARNDSYTYPAKVSTVFFRTVESHLEAGKR